MKKQLLKFFKKIEPDKEKHPFLHTLFDGFYTFALTPDTVSKSGVHIRDGIDLKRTMGIVVLALMLCYFMGIYNMGHQHFLALGEYPGLWEGAHLKIALGIIKILPILVVSMAVGLGIEFYYAYRKGHGIEEGYLVSGMLIPLIMPPDIPLWILTVAVVFAVIIGKEAFGGTGMNIMNVALLARAFVFFADPTYISGDAVWVAGISEGAAHAYGWGHSFFDWIFGGLGWSTFGDGGGKVVDAFTGATPLALAAKEGWEGVMSVYTPEQLWWGKIPGSIGETSKPFILIGALILIVTRIGNWRIMFSMFAGAVVMALLMNGMAPAELTDSTAGVFKFMAVPWYYQFYMGSFFFAMAFMATDPVTAASTTKGMWLYGFLIGFIGMMIRVLNPAYPEAWMLAILFMNIFAPLIDHYVIQANIKKRLKSVQ